ncbi:MAG: hypothetical protein LBT43_07515 [Prevotella sp.]|jgi:hypothetical protein|nr:hypothetical protein [Prevotella sp.]
MIKIELGNVGSEEKAKKIEQVLTGQSFYNFQVHYACCVHNWPVSVTTDCPGAIEEEVRQMLLYILACSL